MAKTRTLPLTDLVFDFELYPRSQVDSQHVGHIAEALAAGVALPPIVIDKQSKRVVDGFHRGKAYQRVQGEEAKVEVEERNYADEAAIFLDAMIRNANHGRILTTFDRTHCILRAKRLHLKPEQIAEALNMTVCRVDELRTNRVGRLKAGSGNGSEIPLKQTVAHMVGMKLTKRQRETMPRLGGMNQSFYANQLIILIENDMLDVGNEELMRRLAKLHGLLDDVCAAVA